MQVWSRAREVEKERLKPKPQIRVSDLPETQQDAAMADVDRATEQYPPVACGGSSLHVCQIHGEWEVWLNTQYPATFDGLCLSVGDTRQKALRDAVRTLESALEVLQQPEMTGHR